MKMLHSIEKVREKRRVSWVNWFQRGLGESPGLFCVHKKNQQPREPRGGTPHGLNQHHELYFNISQKTFFYPNRIFYICFITNKNNSICSSSFS